MPICIYSAEFRDPLPEKVFDRLLSELAEACRMKALAARRWQDAHAIVFSRHLLKKALWDAGGNADLQSLLYSSYGRPFLAEGPEFNWSHSGNKVVCACSQDSRLGIDIEQIRPLDLSDFRDLFCDAEWERIIGSENPTRHFFEEWTSKEAVLKANGRGLSGNMRDVKRVSAKETLFDNERWFLYNIGLPGDYVCNLASKSEKPGFLYYTIDIAA
jgi:4'-phosphopantetheinyl transferase